MSGALLVAGTTSDAGKSMVVAGLCRLLVRKGIRVAPFKAQNMSNNSAVTVEGGEIGRAQAMQARAAGLTPSVRFNPILLKPGSDTTSQLVIKGQVAGTATAAEYWSDRNRLSAVVQDELAKLRTEFDAVICEGAGSPAEINLRATDLVNMGLARAANLPVIIVGDIDRGGLLAHLFGTVAVLEPDDQALIAGFIVNKFRGDVSLLEPGLRQLAELSGRPTYGVLPYTDDLWLDTEDAVPVLAHRVLGTPRPPRGSQWLRVAVLRLPRISNSTDVEALACEPGVLVRWVREPADLADTDVIVLPGTKSTVADLAWLRERGLDQAIRAHAASGRAVLGICGGFQMLCRSIDDKVESRSGRVEAMGMLDADIVFAPDKVLCRRQGSPRRLRDPSRAGGPLRGGRVVRGGRLSAGVSARPGIRDALARPARQRRLPAAVVDPRRGGRGPARIRRGRRHRCGGAARRPAGFDGRSVGRPPRRRRRHRTARRRPAVASDHRHRAALIAAGGLSKMPSNQGFS